MTRQRLSLGRAGEEAAALHLQKKGYRILQKNYSCKIGELDIIAMDGPYLVFVEVRTVAGGSFGTAQESIGAKKKHKIRQVASYYLLCSKAGGGPARFDVVAVAMDRDGGVIKLDHIINAF